MWIIFLVLHLVGLSSYNLLLRKSLLKKVDAFLLATVMQTAIAIPMLFALLFYKIDLSIYNSSYALIIATIIILVMALHITNVKALQYLEASVYSVLYNLRIIFATVLGVVFLGESIVPLQIAGGLLIFSAVLTVYQRGGKSLLLLGVFWGVAASVVISSLNVLEKKIITDLGYMAYAVPVMIISAILMWIILLLRNPHSYKQVFNIKMLPLMSTRALSAYGFTLAFNAGGKLSVSTYISSLSVIIIVILGVVLLKEKDYLKRKIIATVLAAAGLTLILFANLW